MLLILPGVCGALIFSFDTRKDDDVNAVWIVGYSAFVVVWSAFMVGSWSRQEEPLAKEITTLRSDFVPGRSFLVQLLVYALGIAATLLCLAVAAVVMIVCFNMDGYFLPSSPLFLRFINELRATGKPGLTTNDDYMVVQFLPTVIHSLLIMMTNMAYSLLAYHLTKLENHRHEESFERSLILKRVPFEMLDCFLSLFYLMCWERDVKRLRHELMGLFITELGRNLDMQNTKRKKKTSSRQTMWPLMISSS